MSRLRSWFPAVVLGLATLLQAQPPAGRYVIASSSPGPGQAGGLFLCHPREAGPVVPITGLGPDLTGLGSVGNGARSVIVRASDQALLVGERGTGVVIDLHVLRLAGTHVISDVAIPVGSGLISGSITSMALLPSGGDVLIGVDFLAGPLSGHMLGLVTLETGQVTPVPVNITPGTQLFGGAVAVDATGTLAYYAGIETNMTFASVFRVPLPGGGPPVRVAMLRVRNVSGFAWDNAGKLLVSSSNTPSLYSVDVGSGSVTTINNFSAGGWFRGMAYEAATGHFAVLSDVNSAAFPFSVSPTGTVFPLAAAPVPGTGHAIAVLPDPVAYGAGNPGGNAYSWALAPNPGGLPTAGNAGFSLTVRSTPSPAPGFFALSLAPDALPVGRITFLVNLGALVLLAPLANATENTIPLSIPEGPLLGVSVYGQAIFTEPGLVAASPGVQVTIL